MGRYSFTLPSYGAGRVRQSKRKSIHAGNDIYTLLKDLQYMDRECFVLLTLDQKNRIIDQHLISMGTLTASLVHPREVYRPAILDSAAAVAFVHNHPSGDSTPSPEDKTITERLKSCGELLGIRVLDHVIIGDENYSSFLDLGSL
jgi:DNA repair protein RadC